MLKLVKSAESGFLYVIVTNHVNWHKENYPSDRENREFENAICVGTLTGSLGGFNVDCKRINLWAAYCCMAVQK